jgi:hypothetical protein
MDFGSDDTGERGGFILEEFELNGITWFFTEIKSMGYMDLSGSLLLQFWLIRVVGHTLKTSVGE